LSGGKKGIPRKGKKDESSRKSKDLSHDKCFMCHQKGHYSNQCLEKKKGKAKKHHKQIAGSVEIIVGLDD